MRSAARKLTLSPDQAPLPIDFGPARAADAAPVRKVPVRAHLRTVAGDAQPSGSERRDAALDTHEAREVTQRCVAYVRGELRALYRTRALTSDGAFVTADDVEDVLRLWHECPIEARASHGPQHWRGTVFRGKGWVQTGRTVPSSRPHMNATALPCWRPTDIEVP